MLLDRIEALLEQTTVGRTVADVDALVAHVGPRVNEAAARMEMLRAHLDPRT